MTARRPYRPNRRSVLKYGLAIGVGAFVSPLAPSVALASDVASAGLSQNGWPILRAEQAESVIVEGSGAKVALATGPVGTILRHVVRRFNYEIGEIDAGNIVGFDLSVTDPSLAESNLASGTAVSISPRYYVPGSRDNFFSTQITILRDILADCEGTVRWGGDFESKISEGYFQIDVPPTSPLITSVGAKIEVWDSSKDEGAGTQIDVLNPERRQDSLDLAAEQKPG